jgi:hypothetical protein
VAAMEDLKQISTDNDVNIIEVWKELKKKKNSLITKFLLQ